VVNAAALLPWYDHHRRDLPWRGSRDPYRIWVSEVMLQQTRVETVLRYFEAFLHRFPTVGSLAAAPLEEVLARWSGLGYYRRARQMHAAARAVVARGGFPSTAEELRRLPGIGEYTAAAVASMAFGERVAVLDGNVERVLARLLAVADDPRKRAVRRRLGAATAELLDPQRPGDSNQALMELGATLCTPRRPRCPLCPLAPGCRAAGEGDAERYPRPRPRRPRVRRSRLVALVEEEGRALLFRRPEDSPLLAGTWELPWVELPPPAGACDSGEPDRAGAARALARRYGGRWEVGELVARVRHGITFRTIEAAVCRCRLLGRGEVAEGLEAGWFGAAERRALPRSSLVGKVLAAAGRR
jgi:A/G-specific adenine glycosylase